MKFSVLLLTGAALSSTILARPSRLADREAIRRSRRSRPFSGSSYNGTRNNTDSVVELHDGTTGTSLHDEYSTNWAGVIIESPPSGQNFTTVTGTFVVPLPTGSDGAASAWVGIDGDTASQSILQAGVDFKISSGKVSYDSWYEWLVLCSANIVEGVNLRPLAGIQIMLMTSPILLSPLAIQ